MLNDKEYLSIVEDILDNSKFKELKNYRHHGIDRYDHSLRVSYWSYKRALKMGLDYKACARAGLLHDFYFTNNQKQSVRDRIYVLRHHNDFSIDDARKYFDVSEKEAEIMRTHMFPINKSIPLSKEAWILNGADKIASSYERFILSFTKKYRFQGE